MLIIDLRRLNEASVEVAGAIDRDDPLWEETGLTLAAPLIARAVAEGSAKHGVWVRGKWSTRVHLNCRRCLDPVERELDDQFAMLFDPRTREADGDLTLYGLEEGAEEIDLRLPLRERLMLAVPAFPLCDEGCPGLCSRCGANLKHGDCDCGPEEGDPRWQALRELRSRT